uniref:RING-type E3 ubiquitin transferase n=1 Tax=Anopheles atroparvus TaxID=41427 RepID=A0A182IXJ3_ANOAO
MLLQGILGIMTGVGIATIAAVGLLIYMNQQNEPIQTRNNYRRTAPRPTWSGYKTTEENTCSICLDMVLPSDRCVLPCNHVFHKPCISQWSNEKKVCPNCRKAV